MNFGTCGAGCYTAFGAVELSERPGRRIIEIETGKEKLLIKLAVKRADYPTIKISLPEEKISLSPEDAARAEQEALLLRRLWQDVTERLWEGGFLMPLKNNVSTGFGVKRIFNESKTSIHQGIDIRGQEGDEVSASNTGRAVLVQELFFGGKTVVLDHGSGVFSVYMHLSAFNVNQGGIVRKGEVIGMVGSSGRASGPHLHYGIKIGDISVNPLSLTAAEGVNKSGL